jgi:hypothetical protein
MGNDKGKLLSVAAAAVALLFGARSLTAWKDSIVYCFWVIFESILGHVATPP